MATELILKGQVIFTEKPSIWHSRSTSKGFCSSCGKLILLLASAIDEVSAGQIYCNHSRNRGGESNTDSLKDGIKTSCIASYCCNVCRDDAELSGHRWLCGEAFVERYEVTFTELTNRTACRSCTHMCDWDPIVITSDLQTSSCDTAKSNISIDMLNHTMT